MPDFRLTVYATDWCPDCVRAFRVLKRAGIPYTEINIDNTPGAEAIMRTRNGGSGKIPTLILEQEGETFCLIEPGDPELKAWIEERVKG